MRRGRGRESSMSTVAVARSEPEPGLALAEAVGESSLFDDLSLSGNCSGGRDDDGGESPVLGDNGSVNLHEGLGLDIRVSKS